MPDIDLVVGTLMILGALAWIAIALTADPYA